ncbi:Tubulin [Caldicellulosiruptor saccharolyticus DSM 8903]|uniref:Tubulin n=1 Tax=Caldicellulosiruptor saccharolyticus (strain ATCC 43494 / DSM 8903 / Tp8T 6331) TaxID=351627 RepID=A4XI20_CALS8|nr:GerW family sporulation protein [Caldicellulosiruptor saccharolyticus]ABP66555.1 Tubulin [Caldicellulosiruptor saccharolyticus DSM 8903]
MTHPIEMLMQTTMENLKQMIDVSTIVGDAVQSSGGAVIIPVSKVSFGFVAGGGDIKQDSNKGNKAEDNTPLFAGGTGAGISVMPIAFLVVTQDQIRLLNVSANNSVERIIDIIPSIIEDIKDIIQRR